MEIKITYNGHACFTLEANGYRTVLDPYAHGMIPGLPELKLEAEAVYCSHDHGDHNFVQAVTLVESGAPAPYTLMEFVTPHDDCGGIRVAHLGDLGCFPDVKLSAALAGIDCMLIPVGGYYTIGCQTAYQIIRAAKPRVAVPMHYSTDDTGFDEIAHIDDFIKLVPTVNRAENSFTLTENIENQILILDYKF